MTWFWKLLVDNEVEDDGDYAGDKLSCNVLEGQIKFWKNIFSLEYQYMRIYWW